MYDPDLHTWDTDTARLERDAEVDAEEHRHLWGSSGGSWRCDCGATKPRIYGPGV